MHWVGTWGSAQYYGDDTGDERKAMALQASRTLKDSTLRQIIRTSIGGEKLRLTFSNEYGQSPMTLWKVRVARAVKPAHSDIDIATDVAVTFSGGGSVEIPAGERVASDPIDFATGALERLAVSICFGDVPERVTCHTAARANSFAQAGCAVSEQVLSEAAVNTCWFALERVDVCDSDLPKRESIIVLGDSITDGFGVEDEAYTRWTDVLAEKLQENPKTRHLSVINMGIGTNRLLGQENPPAALDRFERDVLRQPGIGHFVFFIGVNDLLTPETTSEQIIDGYEQMIAAAAARGIKTYGCTILPYGHADPRRHEINEWLRDNRYTILDFDALLKDPDNPERMRPDFDNDGIHPNAKAYAAMGELAYLTFCEKMDIVDELAGD